MMNKTVAFKKFIEYLNNCNIKYWQDFDEGTVRLTMRYEGMENAPERAVESCIWFHDGSAEARVYYTESASKTIKGSEHLMEFYELLNYINATFFPRTGDGVGQGLYDSQYLYLGRLYKTEDGYDDLTYTMFIPYDFYELTPIETADFLTIACPDYLNRLSIGIFDLLLGKINIEEAERNIETQFSE
jgi:hypothetical protein